LPAAIKKINVLRTINFISAAFYREAFINFYQSNIYKYQLNITK